MLKEGDKAPDFALKDSGGKLHKLSDYRGKKIVLYFYPADDTPGCTKEACDFRDNIKEIIKRKAVVIGISNDTEESHRRFEKKYGLNFTLLADPKKDAIKKYEASKKKSMFGNVFQGTQRVTFIIDGKGKIVKIFPKVDVLKHAAEVLELL